MKRRDLLKLGVGAPFAGTLIAKPINMTMEKVKEPQTRKPDWSKLVVDKGLKEYVGSICDILNELMGLKITVNRSTWRCRFDNDGWHDEPGTIFSYENYCPHHWISITDFEFENSNEKQRIDLIKIRWIDFLWNLNDDINNKLDFIQRFNPTYNPREHLL